MTRQDDGEMYVGYLPQAPPLLGRWLRRLGACLVAGAAALAATLVLAQRPFAPAAFEFGRPRDYAGIVRERPVPVLLVPRPGAAAGLATFLLVGQGKHGAESAVRGLDGRWVRLEGTLIYRGDRTAIEVARVEPAPQQASGAPAAASIEQLGVHTFRGEVVDSKCHFGVMNPGEGKPHRACAARCLSGGVPPVLALRDDSGNRAWLVLVGADGRAIGRELLDLVAEPVEVEGLLERHGDLLVLRAEPSAFHRLPEPS